jgi:beta-galactosidase/beta-glucuronidase
MSRFLLAVAACALCPVPLPAADWKPAKGPLATRWAADVTPEKVLPEYPRPQMVRADWMNLNGVWQFALAGADEQPPIGRDLSERILVPFPVESALSGVMKRAERVWYRRTFSVPPEWAGKRVLLHFGAVDWEAKVWVNGKELGAHKGGYDGFSFDVTDALKPGGEQELVVGVFDPTDGGTQPRGKQVRRPGGIYYTPTTGIWQTVWLEPVPAARIEGLMIVTDADGNLTVRPELRGASDDQVVELTSEGLRSDRGQVTRRTVKELRDGPLTLKINNPRLWAPDAPALYDLSVTLHGNGGKLIDSVKSYCGFRSVAVGPDEKGVTRLLLNGKPLFQVGMLDQGFWPDGLYTAPTDAALRYDLEVTQRLGFNLLRKHVKVEPDRWYYWCDKMGILVWQDMPSGDRSIRPNQPDIVRTPESARQYEQELKAMIDGRHNHPCIIMWVPFNEGWGQFDTARITNWIKQYDPTRLVNDASGWADRGVGDVMDKHPYPGPTPVTPEPKRAAVLGEFGGLGLATPGHNWDPTKTWGYRGVKDGADLTRQYERLLQGCYRLKESPGISAVVYTQVTDVETEANGLLTYDRAVLKVDAERVAAANRGDFSKVPTVRLVVPTGREASDLTWRYTTEKPPAEWYRPEFDDSGWKQGTAGFGTAGTPGATVRTEWKTDHIWLRRTFTLPDGALTAPALRLHHDEDAEVYLNGVLAAKVSGYVTDYEEVPINPAALATLKPGPNRWAVSCRQTTGGQYIDVGLVDVQPPGR